MSVAQLQTFCAGLTWCEIHAKVLANKAAKSEKEGAAVFGYKPPVDGPAVPVAVLQHQNASPTPRPESTNKRKLKQEPATVQTKGLAALKKIRDIADKMVWELYSERKGVRSSWDASFTSAERTDHLYHMARSGRGAEGDAAAVAGNVHDYFKHTAAGSKACQAQSKRLCRRASAPAAVGAIVPGRPRNAVFGLTATFFANCPPQMTEPEQMTL
jgi:hypothetical protein